jgi:hypothetical protein
MNIYKIYFIQAIKTWGNIKLYIKYLANTLKKYRFDTE